MPPKSTNKKADGGKGQAAQAAQVAQASVPVYPISVADNASDGVALKELPEDAVLLKREDKKHEELLYTLGRLFREQFSEMNNDRVYILDKLPKNYFHLEIFTSPGGKRRADYYIYGYPPDEKGHRPRFASANQFFPHLIWLTSGSTDRGNCACQFCNKEKKEKPASSRGDVRKAKQTTRTATTATTASGAKTPPTTREPQPSEPQNSSGAGVDNADGAPGPARPPMVQSIFRSGEVVWCQIQPPSWRLGLLVRPEMSGRKTEWVVRQFTLNHVQLDPKDQLKDENSIRPFLAFSVPGVDDSALPGLAGQDMSNFAWNRLLEQCRGDDVRQRKLELEASKIGAANIDHSFSTFNRLPSNNPMRDTYGGAFIGCERVHIGDAIRIHQAEGMALEGPDGSLMPVAMGIKDIYTDKIGALDLHFVGDIWRMEMTDQPPKVPLRDLPEDLVAEMEFRNGVTSRNRIWYEWARIRENSTISRFQIQGRFYPTDRLMPLAKPQEHADDVKQGRITEFRALNNMGDSQSVDLGRKQNRWEAVKRVMSESQGALLDFGPSVREEFLGNTS